MAAVSDSSLPPNILCFQHCINGSYVSCFTVPESCPCCGESLKGACFAVPPFSLPSPFTFVATGQTNSQEKLSCCLVIKPTFGDFLTTYKSGDDLHIGITNSDGEIYSFDEAGVASSLCWRYCLLLEMASVKSSSFVKSWDAKLIEHSGLQSWTSQMYDAECHNCYSFVLEFLNKLSRKNYSKEQFCEQFITPGTMRAGQYVSIFRKITHDGFYCH